MGISPVFLPNQIIFMQTHLSASRDVHVPILLQLICYYRNTSALSSRGLGLALTMSSNRAVKKNLLHFMDVLLETMALCPDKSPPSA